LRPGGTLQAAWSVYSGKIAGPTYDAFAAGIGDYKIVTTLCPGGKGTDATVDVARMRSNDSIHC